MKCPLFVMVASRVERSRGIAYIECIKEECAWWDSDNSRCAVLSLYVEVDTLTNLFGEMTRKMPHEGQFRK